MSLWDKILLVALGGALGALARYGVVSLAARIIPDFPWGTLAVNLVGCLLIGLSFAVADQRGLLPPAARLFFMTGFLGAMTTFSTYALESVAMVRAGDLGLMATNLAAHNLGGLAATLAGIWLGSRA